MLDERDLRLYAMIPIVRYSKILFFTFFLSHVVSTVLTNDPPKPQSEQFMAKGATY